VGRNGTRKKGEENRTKDHQSVPEVTKGKKEQLEKAKKNQEK